MSQSDQVIALLKQQLKAVNKTYAQVADALALSEASVKRLFSEKNISLQRLEKIAQLAGLDMTDLFQLLDKSQQHISQLTQEQEQTIANDLELMLVALSVVNGYSYRDLLNHYNVSESLLIRKLAQLDKLKIIELLPNNLIRLKVAPNFHWLPNGPIQRFFQAKVEKDFFQSRFDRESEKLLVLNGVLTPESNKALQKLMVRWGKEFNELMQTDQAVEMDKRKGTTMVLALREWQYSLFQKHSRNSEA